MFMVLTSWLCHCKSSPDSRHECGTAAHVWTKHMDLSHWPACRRLENNAIYYYSARRLILILLLQRGRRLSRPRWLVTYPDSLPRVWSPCSAVVFHALLHVLCIVSVLLMSLFLCLTTQLHFAAACFWVLCSTCELHSCIFAWSEPVTLKY